MPSGCRFLPLSGAKNKKKSVTNTTEPAKEDVKTGKAQPAIEGIKSNCKGNKHSEFSKTEALKMGTTKCLLR